MNLYFAPMEGITSYTYRNAHYELFGGCDEYFAPFIVPTDNERLSMKTLRDIKDENNRTSLDLVLGTSWDLIAGVSWDLLSGDLLGSCVRDLLGSHSRDLLGSCVRDFLRISIRGSPGSLMISGTSQPPFSQALTGLFWREEQKVTRPSEQEKISPGTGFLFSCPCP